mgnify:CR=1 FL=1
MIYRGLSWSCLLFGLFLFWTSWEIVRFQQTAGDIIAMLFLGMIGASIIGLGLLGLWECRRKRG